MEVHEPFTLNLVLGGSMVVLALVLVNWKVKGEEE